MKLYIQGEIIVESDGNQTTHVIDETPHFFDSVSHSAEELCEEFIESGDFLNHLVWVGNDDKRVSIKHKLTITDENGNSFLNKLQKR